VEANVGEVAPEARKPGPRRGTSAWLTAVEVRNAREPGRYPDGDRLWLVVRPNGRRDWFFRYTAPGGRKRDMSLGNADVVGLAEARTAAAAARALLAAEPPVDPLEVRQDREQAAREAERQRRLRKTVDARPLARAARAHHESIEAQFRNAKHRSQWIHSLEQHVPVTLWNKPIAEIGPGELIDAMAEPERKVPETGRRIRQRINAVLDHAVVREWLPRNPMQGVAREVRKAVGRRKAGHFAALPYNEAAAFMSALRDQDGLAARVLELLMLTAARTTEVLEARRSEFDLDAALWVVPAERMKGGEAHTVFLSERTVTLSAMQTVFKASSLLSPNSTR